MKLEEIIALVTEDNKRPETDWGEDVGQEIIDDLPTFENGEGI